VDQTNSRRTSDLNRRRIQPSTSEHDILALSQGIGQNPLDMPREIPSLPS